MDIHSDAEPEIIPSVAAGRDHDLVWLSSRGRFWVYRKNDFEHRCYFNSSLRACPELL